jgi:hypothetical protein
MLVSVSCKNCGKSFSGRGRGNRAAFCSAECKRRYAVGARNSWRRITATFRDLTSAEVERHRSRAPDYQTPADDDYVYNPAMVPDDWRPNPWRNKDYVTDDYQSPNPAAYPEPQPRRRTYAIPERCSHLVNGLGPYKWCAYCVAILLRPDPISQSNTMLDVILYDD